jgi:hypothetical protein
VWNVSLGNIVCVLHQIDCMFDYAVSVNIINIFYSELLIYVDNIVILLHVYVSLSWYLILKKFLSQRNL